MSLLCTALSLTCFNEVVIGIEESSVWIDVAESQKVKKILATYLRWNEPGFLKPRLNFRLLVHKLNAQGLPSLFFGKAKSRLNLGGWSLH